LIDVNSIINQSNQKPGTNEMYREESLPVEISGYQPSEVPKFEPQVTASIRNTFEQSP